VNMSISKRFSFSNAQLMEVEKEKEASFHSKNGTHKKKIEAPSEKKKEPTQ